MSTNLVSFVITVTAEEEGVPIFTATVNAFPASNGAIGNDVDMYENGAPKPLTLCCDRDDARRDDANPNSTNNWKLVARNFDINGGAIFSTTVAIDIVRDHNVAIVVVPAPNPIF